MIERLVGVLGNKLDLTAEEIADILWLGMLKWQSMPSVTPQVDEITSLLDEERSPSVESIVVDDLSPPPNSLDPPPPPPTAGLQSRRSDSQEESSSDRVSMGGIPIALPDAPALRGTLALLQALKPLLRKVPSVQGSTLDEAVTVQRIAETDIWIPELQPELEPWLDLALVIDASPSMLIWQRSVRDVQRLLRQCGAFRDVRVWSLDIGSTGDICLRPGYGSMAARMSPCSPRELIDPNGRRLVWVMSDCIDDRWQTGVVNSALAIWAEQGPMALVQVLPEWLWDRTALQGVAKVRFYGLEPGVANQDLRVKRRDRWRRSSTADIKVPVLTLEPAVAERWSQMVVGKGSVGAAGVLLSYVSQGSLASQSLSPQERVERFRVFSSPKARRLAALLSACPIVTLPIIRMVQDAMLSDSDQVHVAEVLLGGLFDPIVPVENFANPDEVEYKLQDAETRQILLGGTPPSDTFQILSRWISQRLGKSLDEFVAILQDPQQSIELGAEAQTFAGVTVDVLKRQGGRYTQIAEEIESRWFGRRDVAPEPETELSKERLLDTLEILEFETAQLIEPEESLPFPPLQTQEVEVVTIVFEAEPEELQPFEFETATIERKVDPRRSNFLQNLFGRRAQQDEQRIDWVIQKQRRQAYQWVERLGDDLQLEMVAIPEGTFMMGSPENELDRSSSEGPQHEVSVPSFFMGKYPVTQAQWRFVAELPQVNRELNLDPSSSTGDKRPIEQVSWYDVVEFCDRFSTYTRREYRLPAEAEWEYACRAGTRTRYHFGDVIVPELANYSNDQRAMLASSRSSSLFNTRQLATVEREIQPGQTGRIRFQGTFWSARCSAAITIPAGEQVDVIGTQGPVLLVEPSVARYYKKRTTPVGSFKIANAFGLYDMHGNVWEWCLDHWHDNYEGAPTDGSTWFSDNENTSRVLRGGSLLSDPRDCRSALRIISPPNNRASDIGFRVVCRALRILQ
jgi:formylglycine-generating enzyme required for sulfatase activity